MISNVQIASSSAMEALTLATETLGKRLLLGLKQFERADRSIPGGMTRSRLWDPYPIYITEGNGSSVRDLDGNEYIDCNLGFGPLVLGHRHPKVLQALTRQMSKGLHFGAGCVQEGELAELIISHTPGAERLVFVNSGTEATLAALRLARAATGRDKVLKVEGGWHGVQEFLLHSCTILDAGQPDRPVREDAGIPQAVSDTIVVAPYNDRAILEQIRNRAEELAAVIIEPVLGAAGCIPAEPGLLRSLREVCDASGVLLIIDEVMTGFRLGASSGAGRYGVQGDLTTLGKAIGGGLPIGAVCGRADLLGLIKRRPETGLPVAVPGTFSGNAMSMSAGLAQLGVLTEDSRAFDTLEARGDLLRARLNETAADLGVAAHAIGIGSMWGFHLTSGRPTDVRGRDATWKTLNRLLGVYLLIEGVLIASPTLGFLSTEHSVDDIEKIVAAHRAALTRMRAAGVI